MTSVSFSLWYNNTIDMEPPVNLRPVLVFGLVAKDIDVADLKYSFLLI